MSYSTMPIVGAHYRPPAKALLAHLSLCTFLTLKAEPDNYFDSNAVAVWLDAKNISTLAYESLTEALRNCGFTLKQVLDQGWWHLGYIPKEMAAQLRASGVVTADEALSVTFTVNTKGDPRVRFAEALL